MKEYIITARVVYPYRTRTGYGSEILKRTLIVKAYNEEHARRLAEKELQADEYVSKYTILEVKEVRL